MTGPDRLAEFQQILATMDRNGAVGLPVSRDDYAWLISEVERLRRMVDKPLWAIWQQAEAEARADWVGDRDSREEIRRLRGLLARLEWAGDEHHDECPACRGEARHGGHEPDCLLATELARDTNGRRTMDGAGSGG